MPASNRSSDRSSVRRARLESHSLGLEDELSFGSDEDLMETIGEIHVPEDSSEQAADSSSTKYNSSSSTPRRPKSSRSFVRSRKESSTGSQRSQKSLVSTTHLLPPLPPVPAGSTLELAADTFTERDKMGQKRGSLMGAFKVKGLRKCRDDQSSRNSFVTDSQSMSSTVSLSKIGSNTSSRPSLASSMAYTPVRGPSPNATVPHLGPLSLPSFDSTSDRAFNMQSHKQPNSAAYGDHKAAALHNLAGGSGHTISTPGATTPSVATIPSPTNSITQHYQSWTPSDISPAILPAFPSTLAALEPITVFTAEASKRPSSTARSPSPARWSPCILVFTLFKVSFNGDESLPPLDDSTERTVAHVHVYSKAPHIVPGDSTGSVRRAKSSAGFNLESTSGLVEIERRLLSRSTTASICEDNTDADGRSVIMQIIWGEEECTKSTEWLVAMTSTAQLDEWVRQIKKTSIMINAEELGYGQAIRPAFEMLTVSADDLAQRLSLHALSVAAEAKAGALISPSAASQEEPRRVSLDATQGAALTRSHSADEVEPRGGTLGRVHRKVGSEEQVQMPANEVDWFAPNDGLGGLSLGGLSLGGGLAFPAPPSDLPAPRLRPRTSSKGKVASTSFGMSSTPVLPTMLNVSAPAFDDSEVLDDSPIVRPPTPPRRAPKDELSPPQLQHLQSRGSAPSIASTTASQTSTTSRLRRLRGKPQVIDIMAEFSAFEAENMPPLVDDDGEPIRDDRERRIRFAEVE